LFWLRKNRKAPRLNRKARPLLEQPLQLRIMRGVITSARRVRTTARITALPSSTASHSKVDTMVSGRQAESAEEPLFGYCLMLNGKRGAGRLPVFVVYAWSSAE
jgi:hypothetical protein